MSKRFVFLGRVALAAVFFAPAAAGGEYAAKARVLKSEPIIETAFEQVEECRYEYRAEREPKKRDDTGNRIGGGLVGGLIGGQIGKGSGRDAAAALGAIVGAEAADGDERLTEGELIGGIAGGLIGNQVGDGSGKTAATAAGALAGAIIGQNLQQQNQPQASVKKRKVKVCETKERAKKIITGYTVTYEYQGRTEVGVLGYEPGEFVTVNVAVDLVEEPH